MNFSIRDGKFDLVILGGPRTELWPSPGVRVLSTLCAEAGLSVGQYGGDSITVRGIVPSSGTGGIAIIEDNQHRIHRIRARAIVRVLPESHWPDPFAGWFSPGLIPLPTAEKLFRESELLWEPTVVILGSGNSALQFGTSLLEAGTEEVLSIETASGEWGKKPISGWEVHQRRFEMAGGKILQARPVELVNKGPMSWLFRVKDAQGIRVIETTRVVSVGPFRNQIGIREHPPGSCLYEMDQTASALLQQDVEGWLLEEERGKWLAGKIVRALALNLSKKSELDRLVRKARTRLKHYFDHREFPHQSTFEGKWLSIAEKKFVHNFGGVPKTKQLSAPVASVECFEDISCQICEKVCPTSAISIGPEARKTNQILKESLCTACGLCLRTCPSSAIIMIKEAENKPTSQITLPWFGKRPWRVGESAVLMNRQGEALGSARVSKVDPEADTPEFSAKIRSAETSQLVQLEVPSHLAWEARGIRRNRAKATEDEAYLSAVNRSSSRSEKVEVLMNGEKRWVRDRISISVALFETGQNRAADNLLCKDGSCGLCQISVDGVSKLACQTKIHRGMSIRTSDPKVLANEIEDKSSPRGHLKLEGWGPSPIITPPHVGVQAEPPPSNALCPCLGITLEKVIERLKQGEIHSPEALRAITHVGEGKCHGQICMPAFIRAMKENGIPVSQWIDWRFPWSDWKVHS
ncbi:MAG: 4Fe-4S dicluster domain-containing protein [Bdellovibrio sp.]|nr:4Fe-4S dicluster domain-containing protein [Bdellovibrio sp.]